MISPEQRGLGEAVISSVILAGGWAGIPGYHGDFSDELMHIRVVWMVDCAYSTQKQALNALAHFFKYVLGVEEPVFGVKLKKMETRVPVVLSKGETHQLFDEIRKLEEKAKPAKEKDHEVAHGRYELAARLQYGAGLRLLELVSLRVKECGGWAD